MHLCGQGMGCHGLIWADLIDTPCRNGRKEYLAMDKMPSAEKKRNDVHYKAGWAFYTFKSLFTGICGLFR